MEIVRFEKQTWTEIPKQDNPAFDYIYENQRLQEGFKGRREHCLLICKDIPYGEKPITKDKYIVIEVPLTGDVIRRGLFWNFNDADTFACALADSSNESSGLHLQNVNHCNLNPKTINLAHQIALRLLGSKEWQKLPKNEIPTIAAMIENCCG